MEYEPENDSETPGQPETLPWIAVNFSIEQAQSWIVNTASEPWVLRSMK